MFKKKVSIMLACIFLFSALFTKIPVSATETPTVNVDFTKTVLVVGETYTPTVTKSSSDLVLRWQLGSYGIVSITQDGTITALSVGTVQVRVTCSAASFQQIVTLYVVDSVGVSSNESYYIMNATSGRLMGSSSSVSGDYANVVTRPKVWTTQNQWKIQELADGRFELYSFGSFGSSILKAFGTNIETETSENSDSEKFQIYRINHGAYEGLYQIKNGENYVAQNTAANNYNVYLTSDSTDEFSYWSFMNVEQRDADLFDTYYKRMEDGVEKEFNTTEQADEFTETMTNLGYSAFQLTNSSASNALNYMKEYDDVWIFRGHGNEARVVFYNEEGEATGAIIADDSIISPAIPLASIDDLAENSLNKVRCVIYLGCSTGVSLNGENLVDETYSKGAHFVLGTTMIMSTATNCEWFEHFLYALNRYYSIEESIAYATAETTVIHATTSLDIPYQTLDYMPLYTKGDAKQFLGVS